jgi:hypothetical protein
VARDRAEVMRRFIAWLRVQPDRPFIIALAHALVIVLYVTHRAVSPIPFKGQVSRTLVTSPLLPTLHACALAILVAGILAGHSRLITTAATTSCVTWAFTTVVLFQASNDRVPRLGLWAAALSFVIFVATFLMLVRWGVDGDDSEVT